MMRPRPTGRQANILLLGGVIAFMLVVAEIGLRFIAPQPTYSRLLSQLGGYYTTSEYNTFTLKPNYEGTQPSMEGPEKVRTSINSYGLRGPELNGDPKIVMLGDSYTFGAYVGNDDTFSALLERRLQKDGFKYQVANAGYTDGFETDQQFVWLKHNIDKLAPKLVVLNVFLGNDIYFINPDAWADLDSDGLPSKWLDRNLSVQPTGIIRNTQAGVITVGVESIYRVPLLRDSHVFVLIGRVADLLKNRLLGLPTGFQEEALQHIFGVYNERFTDREALFLKLVLAMNRMVQERGAKFVVTLLPISFMIEREKMDLVLPRSKFRNAESVYYARLSRLLREHEIPFLNVEDAMKQNREGPFFPANGEVHFNRRGHSFTAERLYQFLREGNFLAAQ